MKRQATDPRLGGVRINLGCGPVQPDGWINVDCSNRARLARYVPVIDRVLTKLGIIPPTEFSRRTTIWNLKRPLPVPDEGVTAFYAGELLEHLTLEDGRRLLKECYRALIPGGILRVCVPDNYEFWARYCRAVEENLARPDETWNDEDSTRSVWLFFKDICVDRPILSSMGHFHKWAFDQISLTLEFKRAGFTGVSRRKFQDSDIPGIELVERSDFLIVEGQKPRRVSRSVLESSS